MGLVYLLDTNVISELRKKSPMLMVKNKLALLENSCAISSVTLHELYYGYNAMPEGKKKKEVGDFLTNVIRPNFPVIDYDEHAAIIHANIRAQMKKNGTPHPYDDSQIASIAISNNMVLVTRNTKHYEGIPLLMTEDWFE